MPFNEFREQAEMYLEIAKKALARHNMGEARANFNMARAIAAKEGLHDLVALIDAYLREL